MKWFKRSSPSLPPPPTEEAGPSGVCLGSGKFVSAAPCDRNAVDLLPGSWVAPIDAQDIAAELRRRAASDGRPRNAAAHLGAGGRLEGLSVLELGPLEAAHTRELEALGADVVAVEGNVEAFVKCLMVKNILGLRSRFLLGGLEKHLAECDTPYDLIFASGVLYHMTDPVKVIAQIARRTDRAFVWTHYHDPTSGDLRLAEPAEHGGLAVTYHRAVNQGADDNTRWWGGLDPYASWMTRDDVLRALRHFGFTTVDVIDEARPTDGAPPSFSVACRK